MAEYRLKSRRRLVTGSLPRWLPQKAAPLGSEDLLAQEAAVGPALRSACEELGIEYPGPVGIFAWSQIYDPRDVLDLRENVAAEVELGELLFDSFLAALYRWSGVAGDDAPRNTR